MPNPIDETIRYILFHSEGPCGTPVDIDVQYSAEDREQYQQLSKEIDALHILMPQLPFVMSVREGEVQDMPVLIRGEHTNPGEIVPRRFLQIIKGGNHKPIGDAQSGRLELAQWLTQKDHPLTSRVMVNRIWQWHFGQGLVNTTENFGSTGDKPSHPKLLDWLAVRFVEENWSIKKLHKIILLSNAYQMSSNYNEASAETDPANLFYWRMNRRRLEVEAIRDAVLFLSGDLDLKMGGAPVRVKSQDPTSDDLEKNKDVYSKENRRSVYLPVIRTSVYEVFALLDFPDPSTPTGKRVSTTIAPQALFFMNSPWLIEKSGTFANRLIDSKGNSGELMLKMMYNMALGRAPSQEESKWFLAYVNQFRETLTAIENAEDIKLKVWQNVCQVMFQSNEFIYLN